MKKLRIVILGLGTAELLLRRCQLYGDAGVPMRASETAFVR
jgi:hypothetical protein